MPTPTPEALDALRRCHQEIRGGTFRRDQINTVRQYAQSWKEAEPFDRLQGASVGSEIYDYYGMYVEAERALDAYDLQELLAYLRQKAGKRLPEFKRELWVVFAHAQTLYRAEDYPKVDELLSECSNLLRAADPEEAFFGTRARLAYFKGQVRRQVGDHEEGVRQFGESIELAVRRLRQKAWFTEFVAPDVHVKSELSAEERTRQFLQAQKLAHWTIAKCEALGLAWIYYVTGRLSDASRSLAVGTALFRSTEDSVHRAYSDLLMGAVQRARDANNPKRLSNALKVMDKASKALEDHPLFRVRATYEMALAHLHAGDLKNAAESIKALERFVPAFERSVDSRALRWHCQILVLKSRLLRKDGANEDAAKNAERAVRRSRDGNQFIVQAEALIALAEAYYEIGTATSLENALAQLSEARRLGRENPKTGAVCSLHSARVQLKRGYPEAARDEFRRWENEYRPHVEHGFVRQLADQVGAKLWPSDGELKLEGLSFKVNDHNLKCLLLKKVLAIPGLSQAEQASRLGLKNVRDVRRWCRLCGLVRAPFRRRSRARR